MNDRELLELAAKAAGVPVDGCTLYPKNGLRLVDEHHNFVRYWNPLTDDGDALRLAVKLNMRLDILDFAGWSLAATRNNPLEVEWVEEHHGQHGAEAATRRAIVRAAAEIGARL